MASPRASAIWAQGGVDELKVAVGELHRVGDAGAFLGVALGPVKDR
jgi:hypothetical protein